MDAGNSNMPPIANIARGNTSVCATPASMASFSATLPGVVDACGVNESMRRSAPDPVTAMVRSASSAIAGIDTSTMVPCRKRVGPSIATAPDIADASVPARPRIAASAATSPARARLRCVIRRARSGTNASTRTPSTATENTINIGASKPYCTSGVVIADLLNCRRSWIALPE